MRCGVGVMLCGVLSVVVWFGVVYCVEWSGMVCGVL